MRSVLGQMDGEERLVIQQLRLKDILAEAYVAGRRPQILRYVFHREIAGLCRAFQVDLPYYIERTQRTG